MLKGFSYLSHLIHPLPLLLLLVIVIIFYYIIKEFPVFKVHELFDFLELLLPLLRDLLQGYLY